MEASATTICAVASAPGGGRRAVLRLSGPDCARVVRACCRVAGAPPALAARGLWAARIEDGLGAQPALLLWMPGPRSYTREDVAELHLIGSPPLVQAALARLLALGALPAAPGEFTRRAFASGRLDLTRAEGVLELVAARSVEERRAASALLAGGLDGRVAALRERLDDLRALTEASLDFDDSDAGHVPLEELGAGGRALLAGLEQAAGWERRRAPGTGLPRVVLTGAPNAGKSSLLNRLTGGDALAPALVSPQAGTTRDAKIGRWVVQGAPVLLVDTAGDDPAASGEADAAAQVRSAAQRTGADLELRVVDATRAAPGPLPAPPALVAWNQTDRPGAAPAPPGALPVSALTGAGLDRLERAVATALAGGTSGLGRELSARHLGALAAATDETRRALEGLTRGLPLDLFAEGLRAATAALDLITGRTTPEDVLDRIFARFCLGK